MSAKILVLEDDEQLRNVLSTVLQAEGFEVRAASRAEEAVQLAQADPPDLVVADIRMEGMDGLDALALMRERNPGMRSLVVTGYSTEADSIRAIRLGVGDYLKKPFNLSDFLESIQRILAARQEERARLQQESGMRQALLWALRALVTSSRPALKRVEERCRLVGERLGFSAESQETALLTCYYSLAQEIGQAASFAGALTASMRAQLEGLEEHFDGSGPLQRRGEQIPREARLAAVVLATLETELPEESLARHLDASQPGKFDPDVLAALAGGAASPESPEDGAHRRGLLSLARALEEARQAAPAREAYERLARVPLANRETVEAFAGLARLAGRGGQPEGLLENFKRALLVAEQLGPSLAARTALEGAVALLGQREALPWAERARQWFSQAEQPAGVAASDLLAGFLQDGPPPDQAAARLAPSEHSPFLARHAPWMLPLLLQRPAWWETPELRRLGLRLLREQGDWAAAWWKSDRATPELRRQLAGQWTRHGLVEHVPAVFEALRQDTDPEVRGSVAGLGVSADEPAPVLLRIHSMGAFEVYRGQERVPDAAWKTQKIRHFFALLASRRNRPLNEEVAIEAFWPGEVDRAKQNLYWANSVIRRALKGLPYDPIERVQSQLQLNPQVPRWHDLDLLEDGLAEARQGLRLLDRPVDLGLIRRILELYRAPYLEGCYHDWAEAIRTRLARTAAEVGESAAERLVAEARATEAVEVSRFVLEIDSCNQNAHLQLMKAFLVLGKGEDCLRHYEVCKRILHRELEMEPNLAIFEAYQRARLLV